MSAAGRPGAAIALAVALREEERAIVGFVEERGAGARSSSIRRGSIAGVKAVLIRTGMGKENARARTGEGLAGETPALVVALGFGGALRDGLEPGDIVVAAEVLDASDGRVHAAPADLLDAAAALSAPGLRVIAGRIVTVGKVLRSAAEKERLGRELAADAADMESSGVLAAAGERGIPVLCARAIIDERALDLRIDFARILTADGEPRPIAILKAVAANPALAIDLAALRGRARTAARALGIFAAAPGPPLRGRRP